MIVLMSLVLFLQYQCISSFNNNQKILSTSLSTSSSSFQLLSPLGHYNSISNSHRIKHRIEINPLYATNTKVDTKSTVNSSSKGNNDSNAVIENNDDDNLNNLGKNAAIGIVAIGIISLAYGFFTGDINFVDILESTVDKVADLGPLGYLYFAAVYVVAEILAIPAFPLTASSGYLFGLIPGTLTVLISATIAATISFYLGRTFLKGWAQNYTSKWPQWLAIDRAIAKEGFKVILLLRLSPLLPFALSNYLYGITSIDFLSFIAGTFLGFSPGTFGLVYAGTAGKDLLSAAGENLPWYAYAAVGGIILIVGKVIAQIATDAIKELEAEQ